MLILLNIIILLFLLGMVAIWATYGFFSAFLHLMIVVIAGVIAMAVWEPLTFWLLGRMPAYAWGVGLLAPFALCLIVVRALMDKFCKMNLHFPRVADQAGGAVCGLAAGVLAMGLFLNGASLLPMAPGTLGWKPYLMQNNDVTEDPEGQLWSFTRVNEWSAGFFGMLSTGSMSSATPQAVYRPDLARRAALFRLQDDPNQMKTAHPKNVNIDALYRVPATEEGVRDIVYRGVVMAFLSPSYELPEEARQLGGPALRELVLDEFQARGDGRSEGRASDMINIERVLDTVRAMQYPVTNPASSREQLAGFLDAVADQLADDLTDKLSSHLGAGKQFLIVDTHWDSKTPGAYNPDDKKLRLALPQVRLQVASGSGELKLLPMVGYSVQESQLSHARSFTEILSSQHYAAFADYPDFHMGLFFLVNDQDKPVRCFIRELRFDLSQVPKPAEAQSAIVDDPELVALAWGVPPLPTPEDAGDGNNGDGGGATASNLNGTVIGASGVRVELNENLPRSFGASSASSIETDKTAEPWTLKQGKQENFTPQSAGRRSNLRAIWTQTGDRLIRLQMDSEGATSLFGQARQLAGNLGVMTVGDEGGNKYDAIGYVLVKSDGKLSIDIRTDMVADGLRAAEMPRPGPGDTLYVYFQVPQDKTITAYYLGDQAQMFDQPITTTPQ